MNNPIIWILDPGHDINTPGKRSPGIPGGAWNPGFVHKVPGIYEWEFNRDMVNRVMSLAPSDMTVVSIIPEYTYVSIKDRCRRANSHIGQEYDPVLLSLHSNAVSGGWQKARGVACFVRKNFTSDEFRLAKSIARELHEGTGLPYRRGGFLTNNYGILTGTKMTSVLIELGFMTNRQDMEYLAGPNAAVHRDVAANCIVRAMNQFEKQEETTGQAHLLARRVSLNGV